MLVVLLFALALDDAPKKAELDSQQLKKLAGNWDVTQEEHGGKKTPAKKLFNLAVEISGKQMTTREGTDVKEDATIVALDAKPKPGAIDLKIASGSDVGKVVKAIWKLDGDVLTLCVAEAGKDRPKEFSAKEGTGHTLLVFKKNKKK
jgi:uncharacterized protein (TIGR03067 family)